MMFIFRFLVFILAICVCTCMFFHLLFLYVFLSMCVHYILCALLYGGNKVSINQSTFFIKKINCGYSLELPRRGGSNVYQQSMF